MKRLHNHGGRYRCEVCSEKMFVYDYKCLAKCQNHECRMFGQEVPIGQDRRFPR